MTCPVEGLNTAAVTLPVWALISNSVGFTSFLSFGGGVFVSIGSFQPFNIPSAPAVNNVGCDGWNAVAVTPPTWAGISAFTFPCRSHRMRLPSAHPAATVRPQRVKPRRCSPSRP